MLSMNHLVLDSLKSDPGWQSQSIPGFHSYLFVQFTSLYDTHMTILYKNAKCELAFEKTSKYKHVDIDIHC